MTVRYTGRPATSTTTRTDDQCTGCDRSTNDRAPGHPASSPSAASLFKEHIRGRMLTASGCIGALTRGQLGGHPLTASIIAISSLLR
jgi:hypothetical protein